MSQFNVHSNISSPSVTIGHIVETAFEDLESVASSYKEAAAFRDRAQNLTSQDVARIDSLVDAFQDDVRNHIIDQVRGPITQTSAERTVKVTTLIKAARALTEGSNENAEYVRGIAETLKDALGDGGDGDYGREFWTGQILAAENDPILTSCPVSTQTLHVIFWAASDSGKIYGLDTSSPGYVGSYRDGFEWFSAGARPQAIASATSLLADNDGTRINIKVLTIEVEASYDDNTIDEYLITNREQLLNLTASAMELNSYQR